MLLFLFFSLAVPAQGTLDTVIFGDPASESAHGFTGPATQVISGGLGESARQCLANPSDMYGGDITVTMAVDPVKRNFFTVKLWGEDDTDADIGRLYLYVPIGGTDYQVGYRHEGDYIGLSVAAGKPPLSGRFFYSTTLLPLWITQGKTNLTFKIVSTGRYYALGSGLAPSGNLQYLMTENSRGIYRAYTHTQAALVPTGEAQGAMPVTTTRTSPTELELAPGGTFYNGVNNFINGRLSTPVSTASFSTPQVETLAQAYFIDKLSAHQDPAVITRVIDLIDAFATDYYADNDQVSGGGNESWGGRYGPLGASIHLLKDVPQFANSFADIVNYGVGGSQVRSNAWGTILLASRDYGRFTRDSRKITNQALLASEHIYLANLGLIDLGHPDAFSVQEGERYLREAVGIDPFLGSDLPGGGSSLPFGTSYYQVTPKGLTREWGYVGDAYGERSYAAARLYRYTGNPIFRDQAVKMMKARASFRRPAVEVSGSSRYRSMEVVGLLAWRGVRESDGDYANGLAYADKLESAAGLAVAATSLDTNALGYARQMLEDGQYFSQLAAHSRYWSSIDALYVFEDYETVKAILDKPASANLPKLPTTAGEPDFVWADEACGILAIKHGEERLWIAPYWQAKAGTGVNGVGRFHYSSPQYDHYGVLETTPHFTYSGTTFVRPNRMDKPDANLFVPPDNPTQAYLGEELPLAAQPTQATENGPFRGACDFYAFRYGKYLVGMNATADRTFELRTPVGFASATDLSTGQVESGPILVEPGSTTVLYLENTVEPCAVPNAPLLLTARPTGAAGLDLEWSPASGAETYRVKRASIRGGPYAVIAGDLTGTSYSDLLGAPTDYYVVSAVNACGESYDSMESVVRLPLSSPWTNTDVGDPEGSGSASYANSTFVVWGGGSDIGSRSDSLHFAFTSMTGDGSLVARLIGMQSAGSADKLGLMMRESTQANSKLAAFLVDISGTDKVRLPIRSSTGGSMNWTGANGPAVGGLPIWLRLDRTGNTFTGYVSDDGTNWTQAVSRTVSLSTTLLVGLAVCSRSDPQLNSSTFDRVSLPGWPQPPSAPGVLVAAAGDGEVALTWSYVADAAWYQVKRATQSGGPYLAVAGGVTGQTYMDPGVSNGVRYYYVVSGSNVAGEGGDSTEASARPVSLTPPHLEVSFAQSDLALSWPAEHQGWVLEMRTNSLSADAEPGWLAIPGSDETNTYGRSLSPGDPRAFYRLAYPPSGGMP